MAEDCGRNHGDRLYAVKLAVERIGLDKCTQTTKIFVGHIKNNFFQKNPLQNGICSYIFP